MRLVILRDSNHRGLLKRGATELRQGWLLAVGSSPWPGSWVPRAPLGLLNGGKAFPERGSHSWPSQATLWLAPRWGYRLAAPPLSQGQCSGRRAVSCGKGTTSSHLWERMFGFQWSVAMDLGYVKGAENCALGPWEAQWGQGVGREEHPRGCGLREGQLRQEVSTVGRLQPWSAGGQREAGCHAQATAGYN